MDANETNGVSRRAVVTGSGVLLGGLISSTGIATADSGGPAPRGRGTPLEKTSSTVAYLTYSESPAFPSERPPFGFPEEPVGSFFDVGAVFDTTALTLSRSHEVIHHTLPIPGGKPYVIVHDADGRYHPRGAVINFETDGTAGLGLPPGSYRATVREDVQLYGKGGYLDWAVSRVDFFTRPGNDYATSILAVIWDEDGPDNDDPSFRTDDPDPVSDVPTLTKGIFDGDTYDQITASAERLIAAGVSNPGGKTVG